MGHRHTVRGQKVPELNMNEVFKEFYRLESALDKPDQKNYIIIKLAAIMEHFCRSVIKEKLKDQDLDGTIELEIPFIDNLIHAIFIENKHVSKKEIIAASYRFQNTSAIHKKFNNAFKDLSIIDYDMFFETRHKLAHTINQLPDFDVAKYYYMVEKLMMNILEKHDRVVNFYEMKIFALKKLKKNIMLNKCYSDAENYYTNKIIKSPKDSEIRHDWGRILRKFEKYDEATSCYDNIIKLGLTNHWTRMIKADIQVDLKNRKGALDGYEEIIKTDPENPYGYYNKGLLLYEFEEYESSTKCFSKVIELGSDDVDSAYYMKGLSLLLSEKYAESIKYFNMCSNKENDPHLLLDFGIALQKNGNSVKSTEYLVKSLLLFSRSNFHYTLKEYCLGSSMAGTWSARHGHALF